MKTDFPVLVATDLTADSEPALQRAYAFARAMNTKLLVVHVVPELRHHPLAPTLADNETFATTTLLKRAAELCEDQVKRTLNVTEDAYTVKIESGDAEDEIVRMAKDEGARVIVVGAKARKGLDRMLGHVAERVVRYAHGPVLVARANKITNKVLVATDFQDTAKPALEMAASLAKSTQAEVSLMHVMQLPSTAFAIAGGPLGGSWSPPTEGAIEGLQELEKKTLDGLRSQYGFAHVVHAVGNPGDQICAQAETIGADTIIVGSHGRTGLARLVLGSTAESVIRKSTCSVLVMR